VGELAYDDCGGPGSAHRWAARHRLGRAAGGWMPPGPSRVRPPRPTRAPHPPWPSPGSPRSWTTGHGPPAARTADGRDELGRLGCLAKQRRLRPTAARSFFIAGRNRRSSPEQRPGFLAAAPRERWRLPGGPGRRSESASAPPGNARILRPARLLGQSRAGGSRPMPRWGVPRCRPSRGSLGSPTVTSAAPLREELGNIGLQVRAGLHTGKAELRVWQPRDRPAAGPVGKDRPQPRRGHPAQARGLRPRRSRRQGPRRRSRQLQIGVGGPTRTMASGPWSARCPPKFSAFSALRQNA
jgi:hypothetical protein